MRRSADRPPDERIINHLVPSGRTVGELVRLFRRPFYRGGVIGLLLLLLFLACLPAAAQPPAHRVVMIVCDALTFDDFHDNAFPHLYYLAENSAIGLMNTAVHGKKTPTSALLTIAAGEQAAAEPTDEQAFNGGETVPDERGTATEIFARRTSIMNSEQNANLHLGIASLTRRGLDRQRLGALLAEARPPVKTAVYGNADADTPLRRATLLTVDEKGVGFGDVALVRHQPDAPFGITDAPDLLAKAAAESEAALTVLQIGDLARLEAIRSHLSDQAYLAGRRDALRRLDLLLFLLQTERIISGDADLLLISPCPPAADSQRPYAWERLTPLLASGPDFPPGLLTSATTRTRGLLANIDIVPTVLNLFHVASTLPLTGRMFRSEPVVVKGQERIGRLARLDFVVWLNTRAIPRVMPPLVIACFLGVVAGMAAFRWGGLDAARGFAPWIVFTLAMPLALMLAPLAIPPTLWEYALRIVGWMIVLALVAYALARPLRLAPPLIIVALTLLALTLDTLAGQTLQKDAVISNYPLSGIRYYGIGNEYLGILLGFALTGGFLWLDGRRAAFPPQRDSARARFLLLSVWAGLAFVCGWPGWGANAGSLAATGAGFGVGGAILMGKRATWRIALLSVLGGFALAFAFGALDAWLARQGLALAPSHSGAALAAASQGRGTVYLVAIALRKIVMNFRLFVSFWFLLVVLMLVLLALFARLLVGDALNALLAIKPWTRSGIPAVAASLIASLLFKDSGVVTVAFIFGGTALLLLWYVFTGQKAPQHAGTQSKS